MNVHHDTNELILAGTIDSLLAHMTLLGAALIADDAGLSQVRLHWTDSRTPRPVIGAAGADRADFARAVRRYAARMSDERSWAKMSVDVGAKAPAAVFNGRISTPTTASAWAALADARAAGFATMHSRLDRALARSLGEQAWWFADHKTLRPGHGAADWEMRPRNQGMQFLPNRFVPLAEMVSSWEDTKIVEGLTGTSIDDAHGKNAADSHTATGFATPQPTDNARAFCALTAIAAMPLMHSPVSPTISAAHLRRSEAARARLLMPVVVRPTSPHRLRTMLRSAALVESAAADGPGGDTLLRRAALSRLASLGAAAIVTFPVLVSDNPNAPERIALSGEVITCPS